MSVILVIRPDVSQAEILHDVARRIGSELLVVDSTARAVDAIGRQIPDLILLSAFLSPRDEDTLMDRLRSLEGASHLQTLSIPQFSTQEESKQKKKPGFGFRKKQKAHVQVGADPAAFAEEVQTLLQRAREIRSRPAPCEPIRSVILDEPRFDARAGDAPLEAAIAAEPFAAESLLEQVSVEALLESWPIEAPRAVEVPVVVAAPAVEEPLAEEPVIEEAATEALSGPPLFEAPVAPLPPALSMADEIDQLVRRLGIDVRLDAEPDDTDVFDVSAPPVRGLSGQDRRRSADAALPPIDAEAIRESAMAEARAAAEREAREAREAEIARVQAEADMVREAAIAEARAVAEREAREALAADLQRSQAEAEQVRERAIAEARAAAEREAREALAADLQRVQAEAEQMREAAIAEARAAAEREARDTLAVEVARVRFEAESTFTDALNRVKTEAQEAERRRDEAERLKAQRANEEAQQAFARELARVRAEVEQSLAVQLDAARAEADRIRIAEAQAVQERAAVETQLKAELDRLRFVAAQTRKADESETKRAAQQIKHLEAELATVRAAAEARKSDELEELRVQMADLREAAAQHARAAAAEAVAAEVARATARPTAVVTQFTPREPARAESLAAASSQADSRDYLSLWQPAPSAVPVMAAEPPAPTAPAPLAATPIDVRWHAKWALPTAACLILLTNTGTAISTVARLVNTDEKPAATVQPMQEEVPFIEVVEKRVGRLKLDSTPAGAEAILDGKRYGVTPLTIPDLEAGLHTLVLKSKGGSVTRKVTIKANQTTLLTEAIYSGWLAIFSSIPVTVMVDGQPVNLSDDGRLMTTPGRHVVEFISEQFNYRATETLEVRPGETTAHTLMLPMGTVRVTAPEGSEVRVDGQPAAGTPGEGLSVAIGAHEISASHPERGERRVSIDVKLGGLTEVTLPYE